MELLRLGPGAQAIQGYPALLLARPGERALVVADLHIGWESSLAEKGFHIPSQVGRMLRQLERLIKAFRPRHLIFLGDVKHTILGAEAEEWAEIPAFFERLTALVEHVLVVPGNHDGRLETLLPDGVELAPSSGVALWGLFGLFHGHAWPGPELLSCRWLVKGHMHPVVVFRESAYFRTSRRVWLIARCDGATLARELARRRGSGVELDGVAAERLIIMPSFNEFLGGQAVNLRRKGNESLMGPVLRSGAVDLGGAEIYMLDGTFLGTVEQLRRAGF